MPKFLVEDVTAVARAHKVQTVTVVLKRRKSPSAENMKVPRQETEEEYDARLEREEQERLKEAKRKELERIKRKYESTPPASEGGVRFKGRGRMKFIDPELHHRR
ncbi:hypothetical protein BDR05DRAFT_497688 [Suillus weaverae]|nr:hypothetical protein BDR05DRAFT_497688 [Suillus weaverae]